MEYRSDIPWVRFLPAIAFFAFLYAGTTWVSAQGERTRNAVQDGDVVFQGNMGGQGAAIAQATRSPYTHCGIVFLENGVPMVWEAVGPVKCTPWKEFVHHGEGDHYVVERPREAVTISEVAGLKKAGMAMIGRPYDIHFQMEMSGSTVPSWSIKCTRRFDVGSVRWSGSAIWTSRHPSRMEHWWNALGARCPATRK